MYCSRRALLPPACPLGRSWAPAQGSAALLPQTWRRRPRAAVTMPKAAKAKVAFLGWAACNRVLGSAQCPPSSEHLPMTFVCLCHSTPTSRPAHTRARRRRRRRHWRREKRGRRRRRGGRCRRRRSRPCIRPFRGGGVSSCVSGGGGRTAEQGRPFDHVCLSAARARCRRPDCHAANRQRPTAPPQSDPLQTAHPTGQCGPRSTTCSTSSPPCAPAAPTPAC